MDLDDLKTKIRSDPKYGDLKTVIGTVLDDVLEERRQKQEADGAADEAEDSIVDSLLNMFSPAKEKKKK